MHGVARVGQRKDVYIHMGNPDNAKRGLVQWEKAAKHPLRQSPSIIYILHTLLHVSAMGNSYGCRPPLVSKYKHNCSLPSEDCGATDPVMWTRRGRPGGKKGGSGYGLESNFVSNSRYLEQKTTHNRQDVSFPSSRQHYPKNYAPIVSVLETNLPITETYRFLFHKDNHETRQIVVTGEKLPLPLVQSGNYIGQAISKTYTSHNKKHIPYGHSLKIASPIYDFESLHDLHCECSTPTTTHMLQNHSAEGYF